MIGVKGFKKYSQPNQQCWQPLQKTTLEKLLTTLERHDSAFETCYSLLPN